MSILHSTARPTSAAPAVIRGVAGLARTAVSALRAGAIAQALTPRLAHDAGLTDERPADSDTARRLEEDRLNFELSLLRHP